MNMRSPVLAALAAVSISACTPSSRPERSDAEDYVVDSDVAFLDSAGVGELVAGLRTAKSFGAELKLLKVSGRVYSTLDMARLLPTFEIFEDETEAVRSFGAGTA